MPAPFHLTLRSPRALAQQEEIALARAAFIAEPASTERRRQLALLLMQFDSPASLNEAIDLLRAVPDAGFPILILLATSLLNRKHPADSAEAGKVAARANAATDQPVERAMALTLFGRALLRLGYPAAGRDAIEQALQLDPGSDDAFRALSTLSLEHKVPEISLAAGQEAAVRGATYAHVASSEQIALARLGQISKARQVQGLDRFLYQSDPATPPGWSTHAAFHAALAQEVLTHPDLRSERRETTQNRTSFVNHPTLLRTPALQALDSILQREITAYAAALVQANQGTQDLFVRSCPVQSRFRSWCVVVDTIGHEEWHVHRNGWLSGVYYIHVPDHVAQGTETGGCLTFGIPESMAGQEAADAFGQQLVRPHTGLMALFPSHAWHRTFPHGSTDKRICYSFDVNPVLLAELT